MPAPRLAPKRCRERWGIRIPISGLPPQDPRTGSAGRRGLGTGRAPPGRPVTWQCGWAGIRVGEVKHPGPPGAGSQLACPNCHGLLRAARPDSTAETCAVHGGPGRGGWLYRCEPCGAAVCRDCAVDAAAPAAASVGLGSAAGADGAQALAAATPA
eukprot:1340833-Pyramimonas_sp.AAC.1